TSNSSRMRWSAVIADKLPTVRSVLCASPAILDGDWHLRDDPREGHYHRRYIRHHVDRDPEHIYHELPRPTTGVRLAGHRRWGLLRIFVVVIPCPPGDDTGITDIPASLALLLGHTVLVVDALGVRLPHQGFLAWFDRVG